MRRVSIDGTRHDFAKSMKKKAKSVKKVVKKAMKKVSAASAAGPSAKNTVGITPLGDRVLVKPLTPEESGTMTTFGIIIPDSAQEKPEQGTVVVVGPGKRGDDGSYVPLSVVVGDRVMFSKYGFDEIKVGGVGYLILPEASILAIIN